MTVYVWESFFNNFMDIVSKYIRVIYIVYSVILSFDLFCHAVAVNMSEIWVRHTIVLLSNQYWLFVFEDPQATVNERWKSSPIGCKIVITSLNLFGWDFPASLVDGILRFLSDLWYQIKSKVSKFFNGAFPGPSYTILTRPPLSCSGLAILTISFTSKDLPFIKTDGGNSEFQGLNWSFTLFDQYESYMSWCQSTSRYSKTDYSNISILAIQALTVRSTTDTWKTSTHSALAEILNRSFTGVKRLCRN